MGFGFCVAGFGVIEAGSADGVGEGISSVAVEDAVGASVGLSAKVTVGVAVRMGVVLEAGDTVCVSVTTGAAESGMGVEEGE